MTAIISLLVIITLSILTTRVGALALMHTGISKAVAKFQARSAFLGIGFTTRESEMVINDPVRRKIITIMFFLGNAGIITTISSLLFSFTSLENKGLFSVELLVMISGLVILLLLSRSKFIDRQLSKIVNKALKRYTDLDVRDYYNLLHLEEDHRISEIRVQEGDWLVDKTLQELKLNDEGVTVLGIKREGIYIGAPKSDACVKEKDILILYGENSTLKSLQDRKKGVSGDMEHKSEKKQQERKEKAEQIKVQEEKENRKEEKNFIEEDEESKKEQSIK